MQVPAQVEYEKAKSVEHALALLARYAPGARILAGGHSLIPMMKLRLIFDARLIRRRLVRTLLAHDRDEVRQLRAIRLNERALAPRGAGRRHVGCPAVQLLHDAQRRHARAAARREDLEPPALLLSHVIRRDVAGEHQPVREGDLHEHAQFDRARALAALHVRGDANRITEIRQPEREIEQRHTEIEKRPAARFGAAKSPALGRPLQTVLAGANARDLTQLAAADEAIEALHVGPEAVIVRDEHHLPGTLRRREDALDAARVERQWALAQHIDLRGQRTEHVRLVEVIRRRHDDRVEIVELEQVLDVGERVPNAESIREGARLWPIVVADGRELGAAHLRDHGKMGELRDGARPDDSNSNPLLHSTLRMSSRAEKVKQPRWKLQ